jgi:hypothetical protein
LSMISFSVKKVWLCGVFLFVNINQGICQSPEVGVASKRFIYPSRLRVLLSM